MPDLKILYQDRYFVAIDKPAGMLVHPGREPEPRDQIVMKVLRDQLGRAVETIHRLDRPTSGVLLYALDKPSQAAMQAMFEHTQVRKTYLAVVHGQAPEQWTCDQALQKSEHEKPKAALTRFRCLRVDAERHRSLIEAYPETGRYHQIRKHLAAAGFPIVGDYLHGDPVVNAAHEQETGTTRMLLMAQCLEFQHPITGSPILIEAPVTAVFR